MSTQASMKKAAATKKLAVKKSPPKRSPPKPKPKPAAKPAPKPAPRRVAPKPKSGGSINTKGWFGGQGGVDSLDKWYGKHQTLTPPDRICIPTGPNRSLFLPPGLLDPNDVAPYLTGELAGDYGYDPLGLGTDAETIDKYRAFELIHCRWAMLGAAGMIIPEGLAANGADIKTATWFDTGAAMLQGETLNYFAVPWGIVNNPLPLAAVVLVEVALMAAVESYRRKGEGPQGYAPGVGKFESSAFNGLDPLYPGGPLDPFNLARDPEVFQELKVKEIKNGRLAMVATLGFYVQAAVTGEGPYANWSKHVADPFGYNLFTILGSEDRVPTL